MGIEGGGVEGSRGERRREVGKGEARGGRSIMVAMCGFWSGVRREGFGRLVGGLGVGVIVGGGRGV